MVTELPVHQPLSSSNYTREKTGPLLHTNPCPASHPNWTTGTKGTWALLVALNQVRQPFNVKGYTSPRPFSGFQIPVPLQSLALRRYCEDRSFTFNHHVSENITQGTFLVLERVVEDAHLYSAVVMCSVGMLPIDKSYRDKILKRLLNANVSVHFIFEQLVVASEEDIESLTSLTLLSSLVPSSMDDFNRLADFLS